MAIFFFFFFFSTEPYRERRLYKHSELIRSKMVAENLFNSRKRKCPLLFGM